MTTRRTPQAVALAGSLLALTLIAPSTFTATLQSWSPCPDADSVEAARWPHPTQPLVAVLCRYDPFPGWSEGLWILAADRAAQIPLYGSGVDSFAWLDCAGEVLAHVVDSTHMGTLTDRILRFDADGTVQVVDNILIEPGRGAARTGPACPSPGTNPEGLEQ